MTNIENVGFRNASFIGCEILGIDFTRCNELMFSFRFESCIMDYCTFIGTKLKRTQFIKCSLREVDFSEADLSMAAFTETDLTGTTFANTVLERANFTSATGFSIDPEINRLKKAKFGIQQLQGLLHKYQLDIE